MIITQINMILQNLLNVTLDSVARSQCVVIQEIETPDYQQQRKFQEELRNKSKRILTSSAKLEKEVLKCQEQVKNILVKNLILILFTLIFLLKKTPKVWFTIKESYLMKK